MKTHCSGSGILRLLTCIRGGALLPVLLFAVFSFTGGAGQKDAGDEVLSYKDSIPAKRIPAKLLSFVEYALDQATGEKPVERDTNATRQPARDRVSGTSRSRMTTLRQRISQEKTHDYIRTLLPILGEQVLRSEQRAVCGTASHDEFDAAAIGQVVAELLFPEQGSEEVGAAKNVIRRGASAATQLIGRHLKDYLVDAMQDTDGTVQRLMADMLSSLRRGGERADDVIDVAKTVLRRLKSEALSSALEYAEGSDRAEDSTSTASKVKDFFLQYILSGGEKE